jgi:hypothetical protein
MKRYWRIWSGTRMHRAFKRMEGDKAFCGLRLRAGWGWALGEAGPDGPKCKRCYS